MLTKTSEVLDMFNGDANVSYNNGAPQPQF